MAYMRDFRAERLDDLFPLRDVPGIAGWFAADDIAGSNGDPVTRWPGRQGAFDLTQTSATPPTLLVDAQNGLNAVRFGPTQYIADSVVFGQTGIGLDGPLSLPMSHAFVFRISAEWAQTNNAILIATGNQQVLSGLNGTALLLSAGTAGVPNGKILNDGQWHVAITCLGKSGGVSYVDGTLTGVTGNLGTNTATNYSIGPGNGAAPTAGTFDLGEIITANTSFSPQVVDALTQALARKWGLS